MEQTAINLNSKLKNAFDYSSYRQLIVDLLARNQTTGSNQSEGMVRYTKLNFQRMKRLEKTVDLNLLKSKSAVFSWEFMFTRSMFQTADMIEQQRLLNEVANLIEQKQVTTTLNKVIRPINAANLREAHRLIERGDTIGKIVLAGWD